MVENYSGALKNFQCGCGILGGAEKFSGGLKTILGGRD